MGAVLVREEIYDTFMSASKTSIEFFHGYTYSGHPVAVAAAMASLEIYESEGIFEQSRALAPQFEDMLHSVAGHEKVKDVRNYGMMGAIELHARGGSPGERGFDVHKKCFWDENVLVRNGGDILQFSPFLNSNPDELEAAVKGIIRAIDTVE